MPVLFNSKHEAVAQAYIADVERKGPRAYRTVYTKASAKRSVTGFSELLASSDFAARVAELEEALADKAVAAGLMSAQEVLVGLTNICRNAPKTFDDATQWARVNGVVRAALADLGRHYGLFKDRVEHTGRDGAALVPAEMSENEVARRIAYILLKCKDNLEEKKREHGGTVDATGLNPVGL